MARQPSAWIAHVPRLTHIADVLGLLDPHTIKMVERVLTEDLPDGWTATVGSYVVLTHDDGREIVTTYYSCLSQAHRRTLAHVNHRKRWVAVADGASYGGANTLAELIEAVTS